MNCHNTASDTKNHSNALEHTNTHLKQKNCFCVYVCAVESGTMIFYDILRGFCDSLYALIHVQFVNRLKLSLGIRSQFIRIRDSII